MALYCTVRTVSTLNIIEDRRRGVDLITVSSVIGSIFSKYAYVLVVFMTARLVLQHELNNFLISFVVAAGNVLCEAAVMYGYGEAPGVCISARV